MYRGISSGMSGISTCSWSQAPCKPLNPRFLSHMQIYAKSDMLLFSSNRSIFWTPLCFPTSGISDFPVLCNTSAHLAGYLCWISITVWVHIRSLSSATLIPNIHLVSRWHKLCNIHSNIHSHPRAHTSKFASRWPQDVIVFNSLGCKHVTGL